MPTRKDNDNEPRTIPELEQQHAALMAAGKAGEAEALAARFSERLNANQRKAAMGPQSTTASPPPVQPSLTVERVGFNAPAPEPEPAPEAPLSGGFFPGFEMPAGSPGPEGPPGEQGAVGPAEMGTTGLQHIPTECPNCGHLMAMEPIPIPREDVLAYEIAQAADVAFEKEYVLTHGRVKVVFRDLSLDEQDACSRQARIDVDKQRLADGMAGLEMLHRYLLVLSIKRLQIGDRVTELPSSIREWNAVTPEAGETRLPGILKIYNEQLIKSASIYRILGVAHQKFRKILRRLEDNAENVPFWEGTDSAT